MKKTTTVLLLGIAALAYSQNDPSWATRTPIGPSLSARADAGMVAFDNKLYILGGYDGCGPKNFVEYDPADGNVETLPSLGTGCANPITDGALFHLNGKVYTFSGIGLHVYDTTTESWTMLTLASGLLPDTGFAIGNTLYITSKSGNGFFAFDTQTNTYTQKANYPGDPNRRGAVSFAIAGKGYYGAGSTAGTNGCTSENNCFLNSFYEYDPVADTWTPKASLPTKLMFASAVSYDGKGYVGLGETYNATLVQRVKTAFWYRYDPVNDSWTAMQNFMGLSDNNYFNSVTEAAAAVIGDDIYVFGGRGFGDYNIYQDNISRYDVPTNTWSLVNADPGKNRTEAAGFYFDGTIYIGGGHDSEPLQDFWAYNIDDDSWTQRANLPSPHTQRACVELNGKGYFIGGYGKSVPISGPDPEANYVANLLEYDPVANTFTEKAPYPAKRGGMIAMVHNGKIYAGGGNSATGNPVNSFYMYDPQSNTWTAKASMPFAQANLAHFVLEDIGYVVTHSPTPLVAKYDFATDTWTTESHNLSNFSALDATNQAFVFDGEAYIVHGAYNEGDQLSKYNPATSTWTPVNNVPFKHASHTLIATPDEVYFGFGTSGVNGEFGELNTNEWASVRFGADVSEETGLYYSHVSTSYTGSQNDCGTGLMPNGTVVSIYDEDGDLFAALQSTTTIFPSTCLEVDSRPLTEPYATDAANYGNGIVENAMFLNKDLLLKQNNTVGTGGTIRLYATAAELAQFVLDFNETYGASKTLADLQVVKYFEFAMNDHDVTNNNQPLGYRILNATLQTYGDDYYFELVGQNENNPINGEVRIALLTGEDLGITTVDAASFTLYPNPAASDLHVRSTHNLPVDRLTVIDLTGKVVARADGPELQVASLAPGLYLMEIKSGDAVIRKKFIRK